MTLPYRPYVTVAAVLVASLLSFLGGRASKHPRVETVEKVRVETQWKDRIVTQTVHDVQVQHDVATRTVTVTKWAKAPDGTPVVTQETHQEKQSETKRDDKSAKHVDRVAEAQQTVVTLKTERPALPSWSVSLLPGVQFAGEKAVTVFGPAVVGASVERRIIGPVFAGVWGSTSGAAGISIRSEW